MVGCQNSIGLGWCDSQDFELAPFSHLNKKSLEGILLISCGGYFCGDSNDII